MLDRLRPFLDIFIESLLDKCKLVKEVIIVHVERELEYLEELEKNGVTIKSIGGNQHFWRVEGPTSYCAQHAHGLHLGFEKTTQEYIMISDPDIFFHMAVDQYYLSLMQKYQINIIGVSRPTAICHSILYFPSIMNFLMKKTDFPPTSFTNDISPLNKMLNMFTECEVPSYFHPIAVDLLPINVKNEFALPEGHYETGCRMFLWIKQEEMRWLGFQTPDCNNYYACFYRNNFHLKEKLPKTKLLYHESLSAGIQHNKIIPFTKAYKQVLGE